MSLQDLYQHDPQAPKLVTGRVANAPASPSDKLYVTIPSYTDPAQKWGPVPWTPHQDTLPTVGAACLLAFDQDGQAWLIAWIGGWAFDVDP